MAVTPNIVNFTYKKYGVVPPGVLLNFPTESAIPEGFNVPGFVTLYDPTLSSIKVKVEPTGANNLAAGVHSQIITLKRYDAEIDRYFNIGSFTVNVTIQDTILLSVDPTSAHFNFEIGGVAPANKTISVSSENNWTVAKTAAWCTLSANSGSVAGSFKIGVVTTALAAGVYNDTVTVDDGVTSKTVSVTLTITDPNTGTDYLYVLPSLLNFNHSINGTTPPSKYVEINPSASWTATPNQPWINLPVTSGTAGPKIIEVAVQNLSGLTVGQYIGEVKFTVGGINKTVIIELNVYNFVTVLLNDTTLYFTEEENTLAIASSRLDTFMRLSISTLYKSVSYFIEASIPIFKGGATKRIGIEPQKIIGAQQLIGLADASISPPYPPIKLNIIIDEIELFTDVVTATTNISNIQFIKGKKPIANWLSDLPKKMFLTSKATLCFGVLSNGVTPTSIAISGAVTKTINITTTANPFYNVVLPLSALGDVKEGDVITISVLGESIEIVIRKEQIDHSMIYWENNNGVWDSCELVGEVIVNSSFERKTTTVRKTELTSETKVMGVTVPVDYKINTGFIHTNAEVAMLNKMLMAKNMYLQTQGVIVPVYPHTRKLETFETLRETTDFDLIFNNTIE
jgi:hypothetical protein